MQQKDLQIIDAEVPVISGSPARVVRGNAGGSGETVQRPWLKTAGEQNHQCPEFLTKKREMYYFKLLCKK